MILTFVGGVIAGWVMFNARLSTAESTVLELQITHQELKQMQINVAIMAVKVEDINKDTDEIRTDLKNYLNSQ